VSEGEIEGGADFYNRELCVKEEEKNVRGGRRGTLEEVMKEGRQLVDMEGTNLIGVLQSTVASVGPCVQKECQ
jgi:hypothetical protein